MAKHTYSVCINRIPASREPIEYKFRQTACTLTCAKDAAAVRFSMGTKKTFDDLISFRVDLVKDAMRKMYLLHAMRFDSRLRVRSITVTIDGESKTYEQGYPGFPFLYSMLTAKSLGLPESWRDQAFLTAVLDRKSTRLNSSHIGRSRMPSSAPVRSPLIPPPAPSPRASPPRQSRAAAMWPPFSRPPVPT